MLHTTLTVSPRRCPTTRPAFLLKTLPKTLHYWGFTTNFFILRGSKNFNRYEFWVSDVTKYNRPCLSIQIVYKFMHVSKSSHIEWLSVVVHITHDTTRREIPTSGVEGRLPTTLVCRESALREVQSRSSTSTVERVPVRKKTQVGVYCWPITSKYFRTWGEGGQSCYDFPSGSNSQGHPNRLWRHY